MSKLVSPYPPPKYDPNFLPKACWWRIALIDYNNEEDHYLYVIKTDGTRDSIKTRTDLGEIWDNATYVEWEWFDGENIIIDCGLDKPNVACACFTYIRPIDYIDLLMEEKPTPRAYRITEYGDRKHPGMVVVPDLDRI